MFFERDFVRVSLQREREIERDREMLILFLNDHPLINERKKETNFVFFFLTRLIYNNK